MRGQVRNPKFFEYKNGILLSLFLEPPSLRVADLIRRLEFLYGKANIRKSTVLEHLQRLYKNCIIDRKRFIIQPKRKRRREEIFYRKRILDVYPIAAEIIAKADKTREAHHNFSEGKYEVYCRIDLSLSLGYINHLKKEIACFFGYNYWYGGIIKENNTALKTYERVRNRYSKRRRARQKRKTFILKSLDSEDWSRKVANNSQKKHVKYTVSRVMTKGIPGSCTATL